MRLHLIRLSVVVAAWSLVAGCAGLRLDRVLKSGPDDWTMYGGVPGRMNHARGTLRPPLEEVWQYSAQGGLLGTPLVRDSVMILGTLNGELQAVNLANGKRLGHKILESAVAGTPVLDGRYVFVTIAAKTESFFAYDMIDGQRAWVFSAGPIETSPLLLDNHLIVTTLNGIVFCVDKVTGDEVWKYVTGEGDHQRPIRSSPASDGSVVAFGSDAGTVFALDRKDGTLKWSVQTSASVFATPVIVSNMVVVGNLKGTVYGFDAASGDIRWTFETGSRVYGAAAAASSVTFLGSADGVLHALDVHTGKRLWSFSARSVINSAPLIAGSLLYFGSLDRTLYCLEAATGKETWRYEAEGRIKVPPVLWGNLLLVTSEDKYITALRSPQQ